MFYKKNGKKERNMTNADFTRWGLGYWNWYRAIFKHKVNYWIINEKLTIHNHTTTRNFNGK
jgi:hypothetical protein